jgi:amino acid transporter
MISKYIRQTGASPQPQEGQGLIRGMGVGSATALNMIDMIGVGPFITIPLIIHAMGGPQAMLGWIAGAIFALCDGLVWAELGAWLPAAGGSYQYLKNIYGERGPGRLLSFLFIWQVSFSAPLSIASGCVGLALYSTYLWPGLEKIYFQSNAGLTLPLLGSLQARVMVSRSTLVAMAACLLAVVLLYRRVTRVAGLSRWLWAGVVATMAWVIIAGLTHFDRARAFSFPPGAFHLSSGFFTGFGAAVLIATYDYWGYYNVCFLGGEIKDPQRNIPRALLYSIVLVAALYLIMNISILGAVPWQQLDKAAGSDSRFYVIAILIQNTYGPMAGKVAAGLIMWTAFASIFSLLLGYSRIPYAAALDGNYFRIFARIDAKGRFPNVSLVALGVAGAAFCMLRLADIIAALVVIRLFLQFLPQTLGILWLRWRRPLEPRPFRMWLYPLPALVASAGFIYVLIARPYFLKEVRYALVILLAGLLVYFPRAWRRREWPFQGPDPDRIVTENL